MVSRSSSITSIFDGASASGLSRRAWRFCTPWCVSPIFVVSASGCGGLVGSPPFGGSGKFQGCCAKPGSGSFDIGGAPFQVGDEGGQAGDPVGRGGLDGALGSKVGDTVQGGSLTGDLVTPVTEAGFDFLGLVGAADGPALERCDFLAPIPFGQHGEAAAGDLALADAEPGLDAANLDLPPQVLRRAVAGGQRVVDGGRDHNLGRQRAPACP
jgi:hypothetical protein